MTISKDERARASSLVRSLESKGTVITELGFSAFAGNVSSSVGYGQAADKAIAEAIAAAIGAKAEENASKGWDVAAVVAPEAKKSQ